MEYILGKDSRKLNVKNQVAIPADFISSIKSRNSPEQANKLYLTLEYANGPRVHVPFIKCFDQYAFDKLARGVIRAFDLYPAKIDLQGRIVIPCNLMEPAQLESLDRIVIVEAGNQFDEWGMTFGIYEMDNYHKIKADWLGLETEQRQKIQQRQRKTKEKEKIKKKSVAKKK